MSATGEAADLAAPLSECVLLSAAAGTLPARGAQRIKVTFVPRGRCQLAFAVECHTSTEPFELLHGAQPLLLTPQTRSRPGTASSRGDADNTAVPSVEVRVSLLRQGPAPSVASVRNSSWSSAGTAERGTHKPLCHVNGVWL